MNKEMFLKELSERLQVLNEQERQDVLDEYAQHIDLKIESGLSEEEAVRDFGTPEELCAELLDVYHINSEYAAGASGQEQNGSTIGEKVGNVWKRVAKTDDFQKGDKKPIFRVKKSEETPVILSEEEAARKLEEQKIRAETERIKAEEKRIKNEQRKVKSEERRLQAEKWKEERFVKKEENRIKSAEKRVKRQEKMAAYREACRQKKLERKALQEQMGGSWIKRFLCRTWECMVFLVLLCWKVCLFCAAAPFLFLGLFALFCTGTVAVLLQQGYPLIGVTLLGAGTFLASAGVTGLILSYVFTKKRGKDE